MSYLFLSFVENLYKDTNNKKEYYNISLKKQFDLLKKRLPLEQQVVSLVSFIDICFPSNLSKKYYISCPNFLRDRHQSINGKVTFLNNVIIRPELTLSMEKFLPKNQNVILIGDILEGERLKMFLVKGIQFIDESISSTNDMEEVLTACTCVYLNSNNIRVWSTNANHDDTFFTPNKVDEIISNCYTVSNPEKVRAMYEEWHKYIEFRKYYLEEQSKRHLLIDFVECLDTYAINHKDYKMNASVYEEYLLNNDKQFSNSDMVILTEQIGNAEPLPLIRINIDRNRKEFEKTKILKNGKLISEEETYIRSLSRDNVFITAIDLEKFSVNTKSIPIGELLKEGYILGDRFKLMVSDILPQSHLDELDKEYGKKIKNAREQIEDKYKKIISDELNELEIKFNENENQNIKEKYKNKKQELEEFLDKGIFNDNDDNIKKIIEKTKVIIKQKVLKENLKESNESDEDYNNRIINLINKAYENIDIKQCYIERNNNILNNYNESLRKELDNKAKKFHKEKLEELENKYRNDILSESKENENKLNEELNLKKKEIEENETIVRFSLYYRINEGTESISKKDKEIIGKCKYIVYDSRAEIAKITRQEAALENFYSGYVKNPYLSTYLFNPEQLPNIINYDYKNWTWYLESLNEKQKEAVRNAVASNGIFLLQGPPGTGKTQVIAETVAHMVKAGKKVLISSETHKAIDNVFDRLPKIPEIVPIRLIPYNNRKDNNNYDPTYLVDNFYANITTNLNKIIRRYQNFKNNISSFDENFKKLKLLKSKIDKSKNILTEANNEISILEEQSKGYKIKRQQILDNIDNVRIYLDNLKRTKRHIEKNRLRLDEDIDKEIILNIVEKLNELFIDKNIYNEIKDFGDLLNNIFKLNSSKIYEEIQLLNPSSIKTKLEIKKAELTAKISSYINEIGEIRDSANEEELNNLKKEYREIVNEINRNNSTNAVNNLIITSILNLQFITQNPNIIDALINKLQFEINDIKNNYNINLVKKINDISEKLDNLENEKEKYNLKIRDINLKIVSIQDRKEVQEIQENTNALEIGIRNFFKEFEIYDAYETIDSALQIIEEKWKELEINYTKKEEENKEKIPVYEKIARYLQSQDVIEADRKIYTKDLFENANVYGITCTANDRFSSKNVNSLGEFNLDDIDFKSLGIDVVIVDEVSKSSFIDLLIPILYGKTIILVGDHRQLPPMYEFAKLREDDFKGLDENIINLDINRKFTHIYEECFFKTLFEKMPNNYKVMLVQQYRCHEQIMDVFNHFYQNQLKLGFPGQNNQKQHNINILSNGINIIEPKKHIYFVDCKKTETHEQDSTSIYNSGEAKVIITLLKKINNFFKNNQNKEKLSVGVICTYGDQARKIKQLMKTEKVKIDGFNTNEEKMIVSTVDDFQGDERDIIILSMVRNPENPNRSNPGFILAYQRINVALSRARKLLIVVGNRKYLEDKGVIDLPDINGLGNDLRNFRVYEEIISTIEREGKVIDDIDILEEKENMIYA